MVPHASSDRSIKGIPLDINKIKVVGQLKKKGTIQDNINDQRGNLMMRMDILAKKYSDQE